MMSCMFLKNSDRKTRNLRSRSNGDRTPKKINSSFCRISCDQSVCDRLLSAIGGVLRCHACYSRIAIRKPESGIAIEWRSDTKKNLFAGYRAIKVSVIGCDS